MQLFHTDLLTHIFPPDEVSSVLLTCEVELYSFFFLRFLLKLVNECASVPLSLPLQHLCMRGGNCSDMQKKTYLICTACRTHTEVCSVYVSRLLVDCSLLVVLFQMTSSGAPFWSGPKRCPHPIEFDADNVSGFMSASV